MPHPTASSICSEVALWQAEAQRCPVHLRRGDLGDPQAVLVVETGFLKKGTQSAGVKPVQYSGTSRSGR